MRTRIHFTACALAIVLSASTAHAEPVDDTTRAAARKLAQDGGKLFQGKHWADAFAKLDKAYALVKLPTIGFYSARCMEELGRWVAATERYREVALLPVPETGRKFHLKAQADAKKAREGLEPRIPRVVVVVKGPALEDARATIDGKPLARPLWGTEVPVDPGRHVIAISRGTETTTREVSLKEAGVERVEVELQAPPEPAAPEPPKPVAPAPAPVKPAPAPLPPPENGGAMRTAGWVTLGLGAASGVAAVISGSLLLSKDGDLADRCGDDACPPSAADDVATVNTLRPITTATMIVGVAALGAGAALLLVAPSDDDDTALWLGPTSVGVRGRF